MFGRNLFNTYNPAIVFAPFLGAAETAPGVNTAGQPISGKF